MKLLFDENLSPKLTELLAKVYPGSTHVKNCGLSKASDSEVWEYAKARGFVIVSKDSDFQDRSMLWGSPPQKLFGGEFPIARAWKSLKFLEIHSAIFSDLSRKIAPCV